jgi:hypothetical protein
MHILHNKVGDLVGTQEYLVGDRHLFTEHTFMVVLYLLLEIKSFFGFG